MWKRLRKFLGSQEASFESREELTERIKANQDVYLGILRDRHTPPTPPHHDAGDEDPHAWSN